MSLAVALSLWAAGCKHTVACRDDGCVDAGAMTTPGALAITPASAPLTVKNGPATQQLTALLNGADVSSTATWALSDSALGTVTQGRFTSAYPMPHGGPVIVTAQVNGLLASATLALDYVAPDVIDVSAGPSAPSSFGGAPSTDAGETPTPVYPLDGAMLARNIDQLDFQWSGRRGDSLFRVRVVGSAIDSAFYVGSAACAPSSDGATQQCRFQPSNAQWKTIALSALSDPLSVTISATAGMGAPVAQSMPLTLHVSPEDIRGGLYYFSPAISGLKRLPFGSTTATDFVTAGSGFGCAGCHAVSRDGKKVAATFNGGDGTGGMVAGDNGLKFLLRPEQVGEQAVQRWNFATFNPDGTLLLTNWAGVLTLRDGTTGAKKFDVPVALTGGPAVMPEWSPDGQRVAFVQLPPEGKLGRDFADSNLVAGDWDLGNAGSIAVMPFSAGEFTAATVVVPSVTATEYHYFPSWSPDSAWLLFVTARYPGSSPTAGANLFGYTGAPSPNGYVMSYDQSTARLRLVAAAGGLPIELANATHLSDKTTSWPKFAPFVQGAGSLVFFTFGAKFDYGFVVTGGATPQLWMSALDLTLAAMGTGDPSYPPFWLPFQDPTQANHSGIWTQEISCATNDDCGAEFTCQQSTCVSIIPQ